MPRDFELDRLFEAKQSAWQEVDRVKKRMDGAWDDSRRLQDRYGSEVVRLKEERDRTFDKMQEAHEDSRRAFGNGNHGDTRVYADRRNAYKAELPGLASRRRSMISELQSAREKHKTEREEFLRVKARFTEVRDIINAYRDAKKKEKSRKLDMTDIPYMYRNDAYLRENLDGSTDIFFGGLGEPSGPGHGHYHYDTYKNLTYQREPLDPHGTQKFKGRPR